MKNVFVQAAPVSPSTAHESHWRLDKVHSNVLFTVRHLVISEVTGKFRDFDATLKTTGNNFSDASVEAVVRTKSIDTENLDRDNHLKSDDFFNTEQFPEIRFVSTEFNKVDRDMYSIVGNLTIRDVTKPVTFTAEFLGSIDGGRFGRRSGWKATTTINRFDYNLKWDRTLETGGLVVGANVTIGLNLEFQEAND
jgi:polyisoprenoid-binding protein YceI